MSFRSSGSIFAASGKSTAATTILAIGDDVRRLVLVEVTRDEQRGTPGRRPARTPRTAPPACPSAASSPPPRADDPVPLIH